jgi:hypothetical protein
MAIKTANRAVSVSELTARNFKIMDFEGEWLDFIGKPERSGIIIIWALSGNGKTTFALKFAKYLTTFGRVAYDTLEEGARRSFQKVVTQTNMNDVSKRFVILNREHMPDLKERLRKHKSPDITFIDSFQYSGLTKAEYIALKEEFPNKLFIFISHADGKNPKGSIAEFVRYDADVKIRIEGYRAFPVSRYGGGEPYTIWHEGAAKYWGETL